MILHFSIPPDQIKQIALRLYTDGVEIAVIARSLEVPYETVRSWIRAEGEKAIKKIETREKTKIDKKFKKVGLDEMKCGLMLVRKITMFGYGQEFLTKIPEYRKPQSFQTFLWYNIFLKNFKVDRRYRCQLRLKKNKS